MKSYKFMISTGIVFPLWQNLHHWKKSPENYFLYR